LTGAYVPPNPACRQIFLARRGERTNSRIASVPTGFHHVTLNVTDLPRARAFYEGVLGFEVDQDVPGYKVRARVGESRARLVLCPPPGDVDADRFSEYRIGLDHISFGASRAELDRIAKALAVAGVRADLSHDPLGAAVLCFRDPDNIALEFFEENAPGTVPRVHPERALAQLGLIEETVAMSRRLGVDIWLRGGWAMDFFLGWVTRDHVDIDWTAWIDDASAITAALRADGYKTVEGPSSGQQLDVAKDGWEMSFAWLVRGADGKVTVAGGPHAGEAWPDGMLEWPPGRIGPVQCPIISPHVQIECKEMWPTWVPGRPRRDKDARDVAQLREALSRGT
jgi:catechol 2,3-dioxygenase-like lactoylglutathione lyase family enzyme